MTFAPERRGVPKSYSTGSKVVCYTLAVVSYPAAHAPVGGWVRDYARGEPGDEATACSTHVQHYMCAAQRIVHVCLYNTQCSYHDHTLKNS